MIISSFYSIATPYAQTNVCHNSSHDLLDHKNFTINMPCYFQSDSCKRENSFYTESHTRTLKITWHIYCDLFIKNFSCSFRLTLNTYTNVFLNNNSMNLLLNSTHEHAKSDFAVYGNSLYYWGINNQSYWLYLVSTQ